MTNYKFPFQNPSEPEVSQIDGFKIDPGETLKAEKFKKNNSTLPPPARKDYSTFPALAGPPRIGDKIAYKVSTILVHSMKQTFGQFNKDHKGNDH